MNKNTIYITSVIHFREQPLSYSSVRSSFNPSSRIEQTLKTISSLREKMPDSTIILLEGWLPYDDLKELSRKVDTYIYAGSNKFIRKVVDSPYKWAWEIVMLLYWLWKTKHIRSRYITKISWRYWINQHFTTEYFFKLGKFSFLQSAQSYSTRLYNLDIEKKIYRIMLLCIGFFISFCNISLEQIFYYLIPKNRVDKKQYLWVSWFIWVNWDLIDE